MTVVLLFGLVIGLLLIGVPIAISLGLSSMIFLLLYSEASLASIAQMMFNAFAGHYTLLAIPFFILASTFMSTGGVANRIIRFAVASVGHYPGGLAIAGVFACMLFAALSGSSPATVVAIGSIVIAGMRQVGYSREFAAGVICNAGTLGILIPPSIVMVVYAASVDVSVGRMFLAGVIPGLIAGLMLMVAIYIYARIKGLPSEPRASWSERFRAARRAGWGLFLIVIILGGIYGGVFTPTEAAAVAAVYAFLIANFVYRDMGPLKGADGDNASLMQRPSALLTVWTHPDTRKSLLDAGKLTIMLMFIIANALILKHVLTEERVRSGHVPDRRQYSVADRRSVHGTVWPDCYRRTAGFPDCHPAWCRSDPSRHHHGGQYGDRHDYAACRPEPVCYCRCGGNVSDECGQGSNALGRGHVHFPDHCHLCTDSVDLAADQSDGAGNYYEVRNVWSGS